MPCFRCARSSATVEDYYYLITIYSLLITAVQFLDPEKLSPHNSPTAGHRVTMLCTNRTQIRSITSSECPRWLNILQGQDTVS